MAEDDRDARLHYLLQSIVESDNPPKLIGYGYGGGPITDAERAIPHFTFAPWPPAEEIQPPARESWGMVEMNANQLAPLRLLQ